MKSTSPRLSRLWHSAVVWSWAFNGFRLCSYLLLLPILSRVLSVPDFGFYWVLVNLVGAVPLLDLGFSTAIDRALSYAMGGATELKAQGIAVNKSNSGPNFELLWKLLHTTRSVYRYLSLGVVILLGGWGTYVVSMGINETSNPAHTGLAWGLTLLGAVFEMYSGWWNVYLRGLNKVLLCSRILTLTFAVKFTLCAALLLGGAQLLSLPIATLISSFLQRNLSRRYALQFLSPHPSPAPTPTERMEILRTLWPNGWRVGVHCVSSYLTVHANTVLCMNVLGLAASAQFGLSLQIIAILQGMATVWVQVKWPIIGQHLARREVSSLRQILRTRLSLQLLSYSLMAAVAIPLAPLVFDWLQTGKKVIPQPWFTVLALGALMDMHFNVWTTFISLGNRLPFLWHTVVTNLASILLSFALLTHTQLGLGALVLGPLITGITYNYWRWPMEGARSIQTSFFRFLFSRPN
jgi:O-antigen/teichoic acid export membrane protein